MPFGKKAATNECYYQWVLTHFRLLAGGFEPPAGRATSAYIDLSQEVTDVNELINAEKPGFFKKTYNSNNKHHKCYIIDKSSKLKLKTL